MQIDEMTFNMYVDCGMNAQATAQNLGISASTVRARVRRHSLGDRMDEINAINRRIDAMLARMNFDEE